MSKSGINRCVCILVATLFATLSGVHLETSPEERTSILEFAAQPSYNLRSGQQLFQRTRSHAREPSSSVILPANNQIQAASASIHQASPSHSRTITQTGDERPQNVSSIDGKFLNQGQILTVSRQAKPTTFIDNSHQILNKDEKSSLIDHKQQQQQIDGVGRNLLRGTIEMALRQTSGDESYFQAPPATDWTMASRHDPPSTVQTSGNAAFSTTSRAVSFEQDQTSTTQSSQTEESNLILDGSSASSSTESIYEPTSDQQQQQQQSTTSSTNLEYRQRVATLVSPLSANGNGSTGPSAASAGSFELSNNVVYEGPATAPPAGDFYFPFSDSNKLPNGPDADNYRAPNVWWNIGVGSEFERASNLTRDDFLEYCLKSEILVSDKQRALCKLHPKIMAVVARGLRMAFDECQSRFSTGRWNCSFVLAESMEQKHLTPRLQPFGEVIQKPNRERSFLNAIISAGIAHAMTKACSQGELPEECSCDKRIRSKSNKGKIEWVACSDDIDYGARFSRDFTDRMEGDTDTTSMINSHNYEVGRRIFKSATDITCSCQNSENGLCQTKKCWKHLSPFSEIGDELIRRFDSATHVQVSSKDPRKLRPVRRGVRKPKRKDLVFIEESPDYCEENSRLGILGTRNRRCNSTTLAVDSCSILCCGRGYQVMIEEIEEDCNCKFVWCCKVKCDRCKRQLTVNICN